MRSDNVHLLKADALAGHCFAGLPTYVCTDALANGSLVRLLPDCHPNLAS